MIIGGSYDTLATTIYLQITGAYDKPGAAAMAVVLLCITLVMFAVQKYYLEAKTAATLTGKASRARMMIEDRSVRVPLTLLCTLVAIFVIMMYVCVPIGACFPTWGYKFFPLTGKWFTQVFTRYKGFKEEAAEIIASRVPERLHETVHRLVNEWDRPILPVPGMEELVRELKRNGYGIYLLSNASVRQPVYWQNVPVKDCFDGTLISAEEHLVKPQPEIYDLLCQRFSLKKEECVFIDDSTPNAEGAFFTGISAIVFHDDVKELRRKLRELDVRCEL